MVDGEDYQPHHPTSKRNSCFSPRMCKQAIDQQDNEQISLPSSQDIWYSLLSKASVAVSKHLFSAIRLRKIATIFQVTVNAPSSLQIAIHKPCFIGQFFFLHDHNLKKLLVRHRKQVSHGRRVLLVSPSLPHAMQGRLLPNTKRHVPGNCYGAKGEQRHSLRISTSLTHRTRNGMKSAIKCEVST